MYLLNLPRKQMVKTLAEQIFKSFSSNMTFWTLYSGKNKKLYISNLSSAEFNIRLTRGEGQIKLESRETNYSGQDLSVSIRKVMASCWRMLGNVLLCVYHIYTTSIRTRKPENQRRSISDAKDVASDQCLHYLLHIQQSSSFYTNHQVIRQTCSNFWTGLAGS